MVHGSWATRNAIIDPIPSEVGTNVRGWYTATVACSTTEAEIIAFSEGCKDLIYAHRILLQFADIEMPMTVHEDNLGTIDVLSNAVNNGRTKHIDVRHFWVRELVNQRHHQNAIHRHRQEHS